VFGVPCSCQALLQAANDSTVAAAAAADGPLLLTSEDVTLEFKASLTDSCSWAGAGHTVSHTHVPLSHWMPPSQQQQQQQQCPAGDPLTVTTSPTGDITLQGGGDSGGLLVTVSKATGCIAAVQQGQQVLLQNMLPCFMRATTDNDRGGSGGSSYAARWSAAGLDRMEVSGEVRPGGGGGGMRVYVSGEGRNMQGQGGSSCRCRICCRVAMSATTDDDRGGPGGSSYAARWVAAGQDGGGRSGEQQLGCLLDKGVSVCRQRECMVACMARVCVQVYVCWWVGGGHW
jgi:hypothetical protein